MELDKKINENIRPFGIFDTKSVEKYIGEYCFFANDISCFANLDYCWKEVLEKIYCDDENPFVTEGDSFKWCVPCSLVNTDIVSRPLTLNEFLEIFKIGDIVTYRSKSNDAINRYMLVGTYQCDDCELVGLGTDDYELCSLFESYEYFKDGKWLPFGK